MKAKPSGFFLQYLSITAKLYLPTAVRKKFYRARRTNPYFLHQEILTDIVTRNNSISLSLMVKPPHHSEWAGSPGGRLKQIPFV